MSAKLHSHDGESWNMVPGLSIIIADAPCVLNTFSYYESHQVELPMIHSHKAISLENAFNIVDREVLPREKGVQKISVREGLGLRLALEQSSRLDLPPFDKSAMDGYAVSEGDDQPTYKVVESVMAGSVPTTALRPGIAVKVMTGAPVPPGTGKVVPIEHVRENDGTIEILRPTNHSNICRCGEDVRVGDVLLQKGTLLGPLEIANLLGCGVTEVDILPPVRMAVFSTGDEIVDDPVQLGPGKIMNINGPMLSMLGKRQGLEVILEKTLPDRRKETIEAIASAVERADMVVLSGGVSVGDRDFVGEALAEVGLEVHFSAVAIKPGRPMTFASHGSKVVFGLPGNPVSSYVMFHLFVLRAAARLHGLASPERKIMLPLGKNYKRRHADREEYVPCRFGDNGMLMPVEFHGSAHLAALIEADGFFVVPRDTANLSVGEPVRFKYFREEHR